MSRQALGRGLEALIPSAGYGDHELPSAGKKVLDIEVDQIKRNPRQPRTHVDEDSLASLAESIREKGIIQPIIVRKIDDGYELIAGERRTLAAKKAGFDLVPAIVYNVSNQESLEFALIENIQRDDLNPLELGKAYKMLMEDFSLTQEQVAEKVGKDRASIANYIRILGLPAKIRQMILEDKLSFGHARALTGLEQESEQMMLAALVVKEGLSVRQCENLASSRTIKAGRRKRRKAAAEPATVDYQTKSLEEKLQHILGTKVRIRPKKKGGNIEIEYYTFEELDRILELFDIDPYGE